MCTGKAALPPRSASGPERWRWLGAPSRPPGWYLGPCSPPPTEPETLGTETLLSRGREAGSQTGRDEVEETRQAGNRHAVKQHTYRWTYPAKAHMDGEDGCMFRSEQCELEKEEKRTKETDGRRTTRTCHLFV